MLEVCVDSITSAIHAAGAGADRLELCAALDTGGVTPSTGFIQSVQSRVECPVVVLIRPRAGDFLYNEAERRQILLEVEHIASLPVKGLVVGGLTPGGGLDLALLESCRKLVGKHQEIVMHRAFDYVRDARQSLEQLIQLGFTRVLTAGGPSGSAAANIHSLRELIDVAAGRIQILPGGGINSQNALEILEQSGANQLHGSFRLALTTSIASGSKLDPQQFGLTRDIDTAALRSVVAAIANRR